MPFPPPTQQAAPQAIARVQGYRTQDTGGDIKGYGSIEITPRIGASGGLAPTDPAGVR